MKRSSANFARFLAGALASAIVALAFVACEDGSGTTTYTREMPESSSAPRGEGRSHKDDTTGSWTGMALTNKVNGSLSLSENSSSVKGTFRSDAGSFSVSGTHEGYAVHLELSNGDSWSLAYSGSTLSGSGKNVDGYHYTVSFKRK